jgi:DNA-binding transcriptional ArsR family regulator
MNALLHRKRRGQSRMRKSQLSVTRSLFRTPVPTRPAEPEEDVYALQAEICRALGHPQRIRLLEQLGQGESSARKLRQVLGLSRIRLSQQLALLRRVGLVQARRVGREVYFHLTVPEVLEACHLIRRTLARRLERESALIPALSRLPSPEDPIRRSKR